MNLSTTQIKDTYGNLVTIGTVAGTPTTGTLQNGAGSDLTSITLNGAAVFNEGGGDFDFRIEGDTIQNLFFVDASTDRIGINTNAPDALLTVDGIAAFNDGAVGTPSITNTGDLDTGLWFPADNVIAVSTQGAEAARVNGNGEVSIGKTTSDTKLDIRGSFGLGNNSRANYFVFSNTISKTASNTHTVTVSIGSNSNEVCNWVMEVIFAGSDQDGAQVCSGRATYVFRSLTGVTIPVEIEDIGNDVTFAPSASGLDAIITATTSSSAIDRVGVTVRLTRSSNQTTQIPTGIVIA